MIRKINENDKKVFFGMLDEFYSSSAVLHKIDRKNYETTLDECLKGIYCAGYIIENNKIAAGFALLSFTYSNEVGGMVVWLEELYIKNEFQGLGLGGSFLDHMHREYSHAKRFRLELTETNTGAARLYGKYGYKPFDYMQMVFDI